MVQLTITTWCYPRRIFECASKPFAFASVQQQRGLTRVALDSAAKHTLPAPTQRKLARCYPCHPLALNRGAVPLNSIQLMLTRFYPRPHLCIDSEVFLPDQSVAYSKRSKKLVQELFRRNAVEICACLCKKLFIKPERTSSS